MAGFAHFFSSIFYLKEENDAKIKLVSKKKYPAFYFSRFGWSYNRTIQVLFLLFFPSQYQADNA